MMLIHGEKSLEMNINSNSYSSNDNISIVEKAMQHSFYKMVEDKAKIDGEFVFARPDKSI